MYIKIILIIISLYCLNCAQSSSVLKEHCPHKEVPTKFAITTTSFEKRGQREKLESFLIRYAESDCPHYQSIYILFYSNSAPQDFQFYNRKHQWKKKVHFLQMTNENLDFRFIVPSWAEERVFFNMEQNAIIPCQALSKGFQQWRSKAAGEVGPLVSFVSYTALYRQNQQNFLINYPAKNQRGSKYRQFASTGAAFISRHLMDLYYADIYELRQMRKLARKKAGCEDLLMNFLTYHFYPQLKSQKIQSLEQVQVEKTAEKTNHNSYNYCLKQFSRILGYNPTRLFQDQDVLAIKEKRTHFYHQDCLVKIKEDYFEKKYLNNQSYLFFISNIVSSSHSEEFLQIQNRKLSEAKKNSENYLTDEEVRKNRSIVLGLVILALLKFLLPCQCEWKCRHKRVPQQYQSLRPHSEDIPKILNEKELHVFQQ